MTRVQRALVVNGDDFGLTPGVNAGIIEAHRTGILTSASLFANAPATDDAIRLARETPTLGVGCHLTLVDGVPVLPPRQVPSLVTGGRFFATWGALLRRALAGRVDLADVERELAAQIGRLQAAGLHLTHLDGHKHVHAYPPVFEVVARLARLHGIGVVRVPCERPALALVARCAMRPAAGRQAVENALLVPWARRDRQLLARAGLPPPPAFLGRVLTGVLAPDDLDRLAAGVGPGTSELMTHPGYPDAALDAVRTRLRAQRALEVALLTSERARDTIRRAGITLVRHDGRPQREASHVA